MPTSGLDPGKASLRGRPGAVLVAAGFGSKLISNGLPEACDWIGIKARAPRTVNLIAKTRSDLA